VDQKKETADKQTKSHGYATLKTMREKQIFAFVFGVVVVAFVIIGVYKLALEKNEEFNIEESGGTVEYMIEEGDVFFVRPGIHLDVSENPTLAKGTKRAYRTENKRENRKYFILKDRCKTAKNGRLEVLGLEGVKDNQGFTKTEVSFEYRHPRNLHPADGYCPTGLRGKVGWGDFLTKIEIK